MEVEIISTQYFEEGSVYKIVRFSDGTRDEYSRFPGLESDIISTYDFNGNLMRERTYKPIQGCLINSYLGEYNDNSSCKCGCTEKFM